MRNSNGKPLNISDIRGDFAEIINRVSYGGERITIKRHNKHLAVIIPYEDAKLLEAIEDRVDLTEAKKALLEVEKEGTVPFDVVFRNLMKGKDDKT